MTQPWPPPPTAEHPSRCDFCPRRDVVVLDIGCSNEHLGTIIVCRDRHEPDDRVEQCCIEDRGRAESGTSGREG